MKIFLSIITVIILLFIGLLLGAKHKLNDRNIPITNLAEPGDRVLAVFAHPDDEVGISGTLAKLNANNITTGLVYLTRGEAGPTGGLVPQEQLGQARTKEMYAVKDILGVDYMQLFDFPDDGVKDVPAEDVKKALRSVIEEFKPTVVIGFDETIGFYGHEDHRLSGLYLHQLLDEKKPEYLKNYYMTTLPQPMIDEALKSSDMFRERYAKDPANGLPEPDVAVKIWKYSAEKKRVLEAHKTQKIILEDMQPLVMNTPTYLYHFIMDREYFHRVPL